MKNNEFNKTLQKRPGHPIRQQSQQDWQNYLNFQNINGAFNHQSNQPPRFNNHQQQMNEFKPPLPNCPPPAEPQLPPLPPAENIPQHSQDSTQNASYSFNQGCSSSKTTYDSTAHKNELNRDHPSSENITNVIINKKKKGKPM